MTRPDGRQVQKKKKKGSGTDLEKPNKLFNVQLVGHGRHNRPEGRQILRRKIITITIKKKTNITG